RVVDVGDPINGVDPAYQVLDPIFVSCSYSLITKKLVMFFQAVPTEILVHSPKVAPIVGQDEGQHEPSFARFVQDKIETLQSIWSIVVGGTLSEGVPILKVDAIFVPRLTNIGYAAIQRPPVEECPNTEHSQVHGLSGVQQIKHRQVRLVHGVVVVAAQETEGLALFDKVGAWSQRAADLYPFIRLVPFHVLPLLWRRRLGLTGGLRRTASTDKGRQNGEEAEDRSRRSVAMSHRFVVDRPRFFRINATR